MLYLQVLDYFRIILRGQEVKRNRIAADLIYPECISYKPKSCRIKEVCLGLSFLSLTTSLVGLLFILYELRVSYYFFVSNFCMHSLWLTQAEVLTIIGFLKGAPTISVHGFNIYHKNRLIWVSFLTPCIDSLYLTMHKHRKHDLHSYLRSPC